MTDPQPTDSTEKGAKDDDATRQQPSDTATDTSTERVGSDVGLDTDQEADAMVKEKNDPTESTTPGDRVTGTKAVEREVPTTNARRDEPDDVPNGPESNSLPMKSNASVRRYLTLAGLVALSLLAFAALVSFYANAGAAIELWIDPQYEPIAQAVFNLVVLLLAVAGVSVLLREWY